MQIREYPNPRVKCHNPRAKTIKLPFDAKIIREANPAPTSHCWKRLHVLVLRAPNGSGVGSQY